MTQFFANFSASEMFKATMVLFAVIDIIGSIPIIIKLKEQSGDIHPERATVVSFMIMLAFLILGDEILKLFGVPVEAFAVAGSFILFAMSLEMILGITLFRDQTSGKTASIVPLAFPIIAGAGTMTSIISLKAEFSEVNIVFGHHSECHYCFCCPENYKNHRKSSWRRGNSNLKESFRDNIASHCR